LPYTIPPEGVECSFGRDLLDLGAWSWFQDPGVEDMFLVSRHYFEYYRTSNWSLFNCDILQYTNTLKVRYGMDCVENAVKPQPTNQP